MLDYMREADGELAQKIMDNMFTFDDLEIDDKGMQALLKEVQSESLVLALRARRRAAREGVQQHVQRAAETLQRRPESRGPVALSEVEAEQKEMLKTCAAWSTKARSCWQVVVMSSSSKACRVMLGTSPRDRPTALHPARGTATSRPGPGTFGGAHNAAAARGACRPPPPKGRPGGRRCGPPRARQATRTATATAWLRWTASNKSFAMQMTPSWASFVQASDGRVRHPGRRWRRTVARSPCSWRGVVRRRTPSPRTGGRLAAEAWKRRADVGRQIHGAG